MFPNALVEAVYGRPLILTDCISMYNRIPGFHWMTWNHFIDKIKIDNEVSLKSKPSCADEFLKCILQDCEYNSLEALEYNYLTLDICKREFHMNLNYSSFLVYIHSDCFLKSLLLLLLLFYLFIYFNGGKNQNLRKKIYVDLNNDVKNSRMIDESLLWWLNSFVVTYLPSKTYNTIII